MEHRRVFERLVLALGGRHQHEAQALAQVVGGGADQVADVLDPQQIQLRQRCLLRLEPIEGAAHLGGLQVAALAGVDLECRQAGGAEAAGVVVGGQIAHQRRLAQGPFPAGAVQR